MDHTTTGTAAMVRRMVRRTLTVIGGSVAGTAVAWAISSAAASADTSCELTTLTPGIAQLAGVQVSDVACAVEWAAPAPAIVNVVTGAKSAADEFGRVPAVPIDLGELGRGDRPGADLAPGGGTHEPPSLVRPVGEQSAAAPAPINAPRVADRLAAGSATDRALGDGLTRPGSPEPAPFAPTAPAPTAPASVPASGTGGHPTGGWEPPGSAALGSTGRQLDLTCGQTLPATEAVLFGVPGAQPGITPD